MDGSICCSKTCIDLSALMVPFQMGKFPVPQTLTHPKLSEMQAFELNTDNRLVTLLFALEDVVCMIYKKNFKFCFFRLLEQFSTLPQSMLNELWLREVALIDHVHKCLLCIVELLSALVGSTVIGVHRRSFLEVFLSP